MIIIIIIIMIIIIIITNKTAKPEQTPMTVLAAVET